MFRKRKQEQALRTSIHALTSVKNIQCTNGNWNYNGYMHGMANGLILAEAIIKGTSPEFLDAPEKWLHEKVNKIPSI
jgi:hypothetical protein